MKELGIIPKCYPNLKKDHLLAELIGVILGDGNISEFPRTERLLIISNSNNAGFIKRYTNLVEKLFNKKAAVYQVRGTHATRIGIYQKFISERLGVPCGNRKDLRYKLPTWISTNRYNLLSWLRGLFEAEGSLSIHRPTYTYNFQFSNKNESLLNLVEKYLKLLGFRPERREDCVRLRKKEEVIIFRDLIKFRQYN